MGGEHPPKKEKTGFIPPGAVAGSSRSVHLLIRAGSVPSFPPLQILFPFLFFFFSTLVRSGCIATYLPISIAQEQRLDEPSGEGVKQANKKQQQQQQQPESQACKGHLCTDGLLLHKNTSYLADRCI